MRWILGTHMMLFFCAVLTCLTTEASNIGHIVSTELLAVDNCFLNVLLWALGRRGLFLRSTEFLHCRQRGKFQRLKMGRETETHYRGVNDHWSSFPYVVQFLVDILVPQPLIIKINEYEHMLCILSLRTLYGARVVKNKTNKQIAEFSLFWK